MAGQQYGRYEVRVRLQQAEDLRAVALLWPENVSWPMGGEIDFMEVDDPLRQSNPTTYHWEENGQHKMHHWTMPGDFTQWHNVGVIWSPGKIEYTLDGQVMHTFESPAVVSNTMVLALQHHHRRSGPIPSENGPASSYMEVDWVKIWEL